MKQMLKIYKESIRLLFCDELVSFICYFSALFVECAFLFAFLGNVAFSNSLILIGYAVNVILFSFLREMFQGTKLDILLRVLYIATFDLLLIAACKINLIIGLFTGLIPLITTAICIYLLSLINSGGPAGFDEEILKNPIIRFCINFEANLGQTLGTNLGYNLTCTIMFIMPFVLFTVFVALIPSLPIILKIIIPIIYLIVIPLLPILEENLSALDIFELAFEEL